MLEIVNVRHGEVLNRHHGRETESGLLFTVQGLADPAAQVCVNGAPAERMDRRFSAQVLLDKQFNRIKVASHGKFGDVEQSISVVYDRNSFMRYNFFIDDNIFFLTDLAREKPRSLFDHFYLRHLREVHRQFGTKFTLNCFFHNDHEEFSLPQVPELWRGEFRDNADWLRLSFHARSEFPDRPYQHASAQELSGDFDRVREEIVRFAGEECFIPPIVLHWSLTHPDNFAALKQRGVRLLSGQFLSSRVRLGERPSPNAVCDIGYFYEQDTARFLKSRKLWYDFDTEMTLISPTLCCNHDDLPAMRAAIAADLGNGSDMLSLETHEQYSFPRYFNYMPDHLERIAFSCRTAAEAGCRPVFFAEGFLGNPSWEK